MGLRAFIYNVVVAYCSKRSKEKKEKAVKEVIFFPNHDMFPRPNL